MKEENRRSFVKKSLATSVSISFAGLIRAAHGATTIPYDSTGPWSDDPTNTTIDIWSDGSGITVDLNDMSTFDWPTEFTINQWSAWSIETIEFSLCGHNRFGAPMPFTINGVTQFRAQCLDCLQWFDSTNP